MHSDAGWRSALIATVSLVGPLLVRPSLAVTATEPSAEEMKAVYRAAGLTERNGRWLDACEQAVRPGSEVRTEVVDLDGDGQPEVFVLVASPPGGVACYGNAGAELSLLIKGKEGDWKPNLRIPAAGYKVLPTKNKGYPDIEVGGPGTCFPVWRWSGHQYDLHKRCDR